MTIHQPAPTLQQVAKGVVEPQLGPGGNIQIVERINGDARLGAAARLVWNDKR